MLNDDYIETSLPDEEEEDEALWADFVSDRKNR